CNRFGISAGGRQFLDLLDGGDNGFVDTALEVHRVGASGNRLQAFDNDRLRQNGSGGGAVTGGVGSLGSHFFHELGAHVFEFVFQFDFFRYGNTVFGYGRCAEGFVDDNVAAFRAQGHFDCVGQDVHTLDHFLTGGAAKFHIFSCHDVCFLINSNRLLDEDGSENSLSFKGKRITSR